MILSIIFLSLVFVFGRNIRGANAWIPVLGFQFQPVEFAKITLVVFLATYLSKRAKDFIHGWKPVFVSALAMFAMMGLVLLQPDMGSAIILFSIWFFMILSYLVGKLIVKFPFVDLTTVKNPLYMTEEKPKSKARKEKEVK